MKQDRKTSADTSELHRRAETRLRAAATEGTPARPEADAQRLVHELQVHQIELEMQNDELHQLRSELEAGLEQYTDLYDFAPVGYLTLDRDGTIRKVNLTGTRLLGVEQARLVGRRFEILVAEADRSVFNTFLKKVFANPAEEFCEVVLLKEGKGPINVNIRATLSNDGQECRAILADITERKQAEAETKHLASYPMLNPRPIVEVDVAGHVHFCNPTAMQMFPDLCHRGPGHPWLVDWNLAMRSLREGGSNSIVREVHFDEKWYHQTMHLVEDAQRVRLYGADITARKKVEEALSAAEETARQRLVEIEGLYRNAPVGLCVLDRDLRWVRINERLAEINGIPAEAHIGKRVRDLLPELAEAVEPEMRRALETGQPRLNIEIVSETPAQPGVKRSWLEQWLPITDADGRVTGLSIVVEEITKTARKQAEEALRQSERRFRALTEKAGELITVLDASGIITYNLAGANSTLGYTAEELVGRNAFDLVHPDDLPRMANLFQEGVPQLGKVEHAEFRVRAKDGSWRWQFAVGTNLLNEPAVGGILVNSRDITERKQAEESLRESESFYRQTLESIPGMVFTTRPDGYCDYQSQQWVDYTGIPLSEHLGDGWNQLLHPDDRSRAFEAWRSAVDGLALYDLEYRVRRHDGAYEWFRVIGRPIRDASGEIVRWFGVAMNIEDLKQVEQELRRLNETLEQRVAQRTELAEGRAKQLQALSMELIEVEEQERQRIAALLHDDLQQVLAAARLQLQAACETIPSAPMLEGVEQLLVESIRKSRHLSHELSPAVLHHSGLVAAMQWLARKMKDQFGLQVQLESDGAHELESSPLRVFLFRAVQELLFNVVKHAGVKTAQVVLSSSGSSLAMTVSDQGQGFSPDILDSYTEPRGFGLLSIRERARYIGGNLVVESAPGKGSRFALTVPISKDKVDEVKRPASDQQPLAQAGSAVSTGIGGLRVLFVDDHSVMRQGMIRLMTGQPNIQVVGEAANGREAIERVRQLKPDVVVMDVSMPEMDGIEATRRIKAEFPTVRVIGLSMYQEEQFANSMRQAGAEAFVSKTASSAELLEAIYGFDH